MRARECRLTASCGISSDLSRNRLLSNFSTLNTLKVSFPFFECIPLLHKLMQGLANTGKKVWWHSSAHILGECCEKHYGCHLAMGPPTDDGFFYEMGMAGSDRYALHSYNSAFDSRSPWFVAILAVLSKLPITKPLRLLQRASSRRSKSSNVSKSRKRISSRCSR